jgi:energy-coupling factor transporter ATP-binding protein EcfA2
MSTNLNGQLFARQIRMLRGLRARLNQLERSRSVDKNSLELKRNEATAAFSDQQRQMQREHFDDWRKAITDWDSQLEKQMAIAERETLQNILNEKQKSKRLKSEFNQNKTKIKIENENASDALKKKLDDTKSALTSARDSIKVKLETERIAVEQHMEECREWVGIRTGVVDLQNLSASFSAENSKDVLALSDLNQIGKQFEIQKKSLARDIQRMQSNPVTKMLGSYWFLAFGPILGALSAFIAWSLGVGPILVAAVGLVGAIVFAAILHFTTAPLVTRTIRRMFPAVVQDEQIAYLILAQGRRISENNCQNEIVRHEHQCAANQQKLDEKYREDRIRLLNEYTSQAETLTASSRQKRIVLAANRKEQQRKTNSDQEPRVDSLTNQHEKSKEKWKRERKSFFANLEDEFQRSQKFSVQRWLNGCDRSARRMHALQNETLGAFPPWDSQCYTDGDWPRVNDSLAWKLGEIRPHEHLQSEIDDLNFSNEASEQPWSIFYDLLSHGALVLETHPECKGDSDRMVRNTLLRAVTSVPAGNLNVTIIDPEGLGKQFSWIMSLADVDPSLVNHRVWTQPLHISEQLANAARHVEDIIQQSLRNRFANLIEYNKSAGPMAVPYRLIVWSNFPFGLDDHSWQSLCSIMSSGGKCGVGVILQVSDTYVWPTFADRSKLDEFGLRLKLAALPSQVVNSIASDPSVAITIDHPELSMYLVLPEQPPSEERIQEIMEHQVASTLNLGKRVVPFESIEIPGTEQQIASSAEGLSIPLGISDAGRVQSLKLGMGTAQHVLIAGKTGSGKSSLLHTLITSAAMKYSPEQLRLVLLDFKKGVEFQVYAETMLSHADIIGIESKREFGVSTLEYLDRVLHARGEAFRQWGVQDLPSLAKKYPQHGLPRILVLIDEFQELFVEDDKLSQQASMLMDRIVRQGRSFGIHLILASQTLGGAYSLPRTTLSQMAIRIALHCDSSDAMLILSEDNTAAERLRHSGQAIYNDAGGRFESNSNFQVAYVEKNAQVERLVGLKKYPIPHSPTTNALGRQIVFEGHKPAIWDEASIAMAMSDLHMDDASLPMILGESVSIDPPIIKSLSRSAGRNVMVVGQDESIAAALLASLVAGFSYLAPAMDRSSDQPSVVLLDGSRNEDESLRSLIGQLANNKRLVQIADVRSIDTTMEAIKLELDRRSAAPDQAYPSMLVAVVNISRFRELRRSEEYSFGEAGGGSPKPDAVLADLMRDGPTLGMHVWLWADSAATLTRWISRQSLRDIELRILMQMSASDSNQLIDTNAANRLDRYVALVHDDIEGKATKFRPFELQNVLNKILGDYESHDG